LPSRLGLTKWGGVKQEMDHMTGARIALPLALAVALGIAALTLAPRGFDAQSLLVAQDDPAALADHAIARSFDAAVAAREINAALMANDPDLAGSFLELARDRHVEVDPALAQKVELANAASATAARSLESFTRGFIVGEPDDLSALAGTAVGDLFVFGDIRDAAREGTKLATGQEADRLILGLACVGLAVTAGTYATVGVGAPARVGLTVVKAARKTGRIGAGMAAWITRSLREIVDWTALQRAIGGANIAQPAVALRAAREAVKVEKAQDLVRLVGDVGRVQAKAGTQAALDGLKLAEGPRDMSRIARLAAAKGGKTRAILKLAGRGAILLTVGTFNLAMWMFWAILTIYGFVASLKRMTERTTERYCAHRRRRRARRHEQRAREERERCAAAREEPTVIFSNAPGVVPAMVAKLDSAYRELDASPSWRDSWPDLAVPRGRAREPGPAPLESKQPLEHTVLSFRGARKTRVG
jgi:hypothetical protein